MGGREELIELRKWKKKKKFEIKGKTSSLYGKTREEGSGLMEMELIWALNIF